MMTKLYCIGMKNLNFTHNGTIHRFENGVFETEDQSIIDELMESPFVTTSPLTEAVAESAYSGNPAPEETQLLFYKLPGRISVEDAKRYADERGIAYPDDVTKTELIDAINLAQQDKL